MNCEFEIGNLQLRYSRNSRLLYFNKKNKTPPHSIKIIEEDIYCGFYILHGEYPIHLESNICVAGFMNFYNSSSRIKNYIYNYKMKWLYPEILFIANYFLTKEQQRDFMKMYKSNDYEFPKMWENEFRLDMDFEEILAHINLMFM